MGKFKGSINQHEPPEYREHGSPIIYSLKGCSMRFAYCEGIESWKTEASLLYCCCSLFTSQDLRLIYRSQYRSTLYTRAASIRLQCLDYIYKIKFNGPVA